LGPLTTIAEIEDGLRITAKLMGAEGDLVSASRNMAVLASIKFRSKELELKGMNMRSDEGELVRFEATDYAERYTQQVESNAHLKEEVEALRAQVAAMGGSRPRPPRPALN
jgi:hypothetical protein